jgi:pantetheine-phosphate adenylyltransferase
MQRIAVFPGSFDPFTKGHESMVNRFTPLFDQIIIAVGINSTKNYLFTLQSRLLHIQSLFPDNPKIVVETYEGLTVDFCKQKKAQYLIRGIRSTIDFEFEKSIAQMNHSLAGIETLFLMAEPQLAPINSTIVREIKKNNGDIRLFVTNDEMLIIQAK